MTYTVMKSYRYSSPRSCKSQDRFVTSHRTIALSVGNLTNSFSSHSRYSQCERPSPPIPDSAPNISKTMRRHLGTSKMHWKNKNLHRVISCVEVHQSAFRSQSRASHQKSPCTKQKSQIVHPPVKISPFPFYPLLISLLLYQTRLGGPTPFLPPARPPISNPHTPRRASTPHSLPLPQIHQRNIPTDPILRRLHHKLFCFHIHRKRAFFASIQIENSKAFRCALHSHLNPS